MRLIRENWIASLGISAVVGMLWFGAPEKLRPQFQEVAMPIGPYAAILTASPNAGGIICYSSIGTSAVLASSSTTAVTTFLSVSSQ